MRGINKGLGGSSSALFFTLGGMVGAVLAIFSGPREGPQISSRLKKMAGAEKGNSNRYSNTWMRKGKDMEKQKKEVFPAQLKQGRNKAGGVLEPLMSEPEYMGFGVLLD